MKNDYRDQIIVAAERLFRHFGYRKTTVADIARAAGVAKGSIYLHFPSKEDIFLTIISARATVLAAGMEAIASQPGPLQTRILEALEYFVDETAKSRFEFFPDHLLNLDNEELVVRTLSIHKTSGPRLKEILEKRLANRTEQDPIVADPEGVAWLLVQNLFNTMVRLGPDVDFDYRRYLRVLVKTTIPERTRWEENERV